MASCSLNDRLPDMSFGEDASRIRKDNAPKTLPLSGVLR
jgi:predicted transposase YbfD/YdcC